MAASRSQTHTVNFTSREGPKLIYKFKNPRESFDCSGGDRCLSQLIWLWPTHLNHNWERKGLYSWVVKITGTHSVPPVIYMVKLKFQHIEELLVKFVKMQILRTHQDSDLLGVRWAQESAFLTASHNNDAGGLQATT